MNFFEEQVRFIKATLMAFTAVGFVTVFILLMYKMIIFLAGVIL